ncbi:MAG TPA: DUF4190 domain-containing protein [Microbacterium sp.]|uniref:DUF4190 domain-containing protein n=1 Tax=Microbacterium sp. TaxID=51671 RepID=UPI002B498BD8|nr:DUF4190 domain-containing protein [Microbacterium sp.]HKT57728.1 DUF4190 domain-containing protein [Microbacterium sp.]
MREGTPSPHPGTLPSAVPMPPPPWSVLAIAGFVTSFVVGAVGIVLSILALRETSRTGKRGRGLAIAGIAISGAGILMGVIVVVFIVVVVLPVALRESGGNAEAPHLMLGHIGAV